MKEELLIVGTYTQESSSRGIYCFVQENGTFAQRSSFCGCANPSYLTARNNTVYAVQELTDCTCVTALALTKEGVLHHKNTLSVPGNGACHLSLHPSAPVLYLSNFGSGDLVSFTLAADGALVAMQQRIVQTGSGLIAGMQDSSHLHSATLDASGNFLVTCNLGTDEITVYKTTDGFKLTAYGTPVHMPPGSGPRHFVFAPNGRFAYAVNELSNTVAVFAWEPGRLQLRSVQPLLPPDYQGKCHAADVHCSADGCFLYVSTREYNAFITFAIHAESGALVCIGRCETGERWPRHFSLNANENFIAVANQKSDTVSILARNIATGLAEGVVQNLPIPTPVCAIWV